MKHRKLRIAWSVAWGILAVLLIGLWGRSFCVAETGTVFLDFGSVTYSAEPCDGNLVIGQTESGNSISPVGLSLVTGQEFYEVPFWLPTFLFAFIALVPWWSGRFSLRTLLVATTLIAVLLGLIVWAAK